MNCQEVTELMQRYLDKDLNETEYSLLLMHQEQCPECTEMFERLQRLSDDLESLPKVSPPYSIVDTIMPQLLELDRLQNHSEMQQDNVIPLSDQPLSQLEKGKRNRYVSWRWMSGVAAAGVILGAFLFQQQPSLRQGADELIPESFSLHFNQEEATSPISMMRGMNISQVEDQSGEAIQHDTMPRDPVMPDSVISSPSSDWSGQTKDQAMYNGVVPQSADATDPEGTQNTLTSKHSNAKGEEEAQPEPKQLESMHPDLVGITSIESTEVPLAELASPDEQYIAMLYLDRIEIVQKDNQAIIFQTVGSWDTQRVKVSLKGWEQDRLIYERSELDQKVEHTIELNDLDGNEHDKGQSVSR